MQQLEFKLLNDITWVKSNPPPNLSCRYFTHATETLIWAAKNKRSRHKFNYALMRQHNGGKQMKSVWEIFPPSAEEKRFGKHPAQKPIALLERILLASSNEGDVVLDPFLGGGTTLVTALRLRRHVLGCELSLESVTLTVRRILPELVQVEISVSRSHFSLDLFSDPMDRSFQREARARRHPQLSRLVQQERKFYFVGTTQREVIYSVEARTLEEAWQNFRNSPKALTEILFVIKTETEIYLAQ